MDLKLHVWRQKNSKAKGDLETYQAKDVSEDMSFLEMLDVVNEQLIESGKEPIHFDHDCREGICGACGFMINGEAHGPQKGTTVCQLHMRTFKDGDELVLEPWRARAFPLVRDLMVDRSSFDRIIGAGGYVSVNTGVTTDANTIAIPKQNAELAMDAAACIGCGACVASCPNAAAMLFTAAKISHLALLPQGQVEAPERARNMVTQMDEEAFGYCTNFAECEAACPKEISIDFIARMNREYIKSAVCSSEEE